MRNKYYFLGVDGSGKSTLIKHHINSTTKGSTLKIWLRSPKLLSKPLMLLCRLLGLTEYKTVNNVKYGKHLFYKSYLVSKLFPLLQLIDFKIFWFFKKLKIKDENLFFDRFALDTLADLMVSTKNLDLHKTWVGSSFINLVPENTKMLYIKVDEDNIRKRKLDTKFDENLGLKIIVYEILCNFLKINIIDNNGGINDTLAKIKLHTENNEDDK